MVYSICEKCSGLMVGTLFSISSGLDPSPGQGHCVVFLGKTIYSHTATRKFVAGGVTLRYT